MLCSNLVIYLAASLFVPARFVCGYCLGFLLHWLARGGLELRGGSSGHFAAMGEVVSLVLHVAFVLCQVFETMV
jgi:hypothetical protein